MLTRRESRGILILFITIIALIAGGIITYISPGSWQGLALLGLGIVGCALCINRFRILLHATSKEKEAIEKKDKEVRDNIGLWLFIIFIIFICLELIAVAVGLILNATIGGELGYTIVRYALIIGGIPAGLFLIFAMFFV